MPTYTHSTVINPGESFVLPPGSKLLYTTDNDGLESVCAELPTEELGCYIATIGSWAENSGSITDTGFWEGNSAGEGHQILGLEIDNTQYLFGTSIKSIPGNLTGQFDMNGVVAPAIKALHGLIADANGSVLNEPSPGSLGVSINYLQIQTLPSMINKIKLIVKSKADATLSGSNREVTAYIKFITYDDAVSAGYVGLPTTLCPEV